jgi:hypothetical protein
VGTTTESSGVTIAPGGLSGPGLMASFMRQHISDRLGGSQGAVQALFGPGNAQNGAKTAPKMPTTTNRGRAYIRRSLTIQWSSQRRSYEASTSPLKPRWGWPSGSARGRAPAAYCGTSRTTGPLAAGGGGAAGCDAGSTFWAGLGGLPIGPYTNAATSTKAATIAPKILANFSEFISMSRRSPQCRIAEIPEIGEWGSAQLDPLAPGWSPYFAAAL